MSEIEVGCSFAEFIESEKCGEWAEALRIFAKVQSPIEEKPKETWQILLKQLKSKPITN